MSGLAFGSWDGHCHSGYTGHGTGEPLQAFAARAEAVGMRRLSFTEHPLFPRDAIPASLYEEVYLDEAALDRYLREAAVVRARHEGTLDVRIGFEVDFVPGRPDFPVGYLEPRLDRIDDAVLSLHFLPGRDGLCAVDMEPAALERDLVRYHGGIDAVRRLYWETLEEALERASAWPLPLPRRLAHLDVVGKFETAFPLEDPEADRAAAARVLDRCKALGWALEVNAKGVDVALRGRAYPEPLLVAEARRRGIALVYGSDAHASREVGRHLAALSALATGPTPMQDAAPPAP